MPLLIFLQADVVKSCMKLCKIGFFSAVYGRFWLLYTKKIHDFLPSFARFKPDFHVPREILTYRKKKSCQSEQYFSSNGCFCTATVWGANWRVQTHWLFISLNHHAWQVINSSRLFNDYAWTPRYESIPVQNRWAISYIGIRGRSFLTLQWWGGRVWSEPRYILTPPHCQYGKPWYILNPPHWQ